MLALLSEISVLLTIGLFLWEFKMPSAISWHLLTSIRLHSHLIIIPWYCCALFLSMQSKINVSNLYFSESDLAWAAFLSSSVTCKPTSLSPPSSNIGNVFYHHDSNVVPNHVPLRHMRITRGAGLTIWIDVGMTLLREFIRWESIGKKTVCMRAGGGTWVDHSSRDGINQVDIKLHQYESQGRACAA